MPGILLSLFLVFVLSPSLQAGEREDYQAARNNNTTGSWASYLKKYPKSQNAKEAINNLAYQVAQKKDAIEGYESFLKKNFGHKEAVSGWS